MLKNNLSHTQLKTNKKNYITSLALLLFAANSAYAQTPILLDEMIVSSSTPGIDQNILDVQASVEIIDKKRVGALSLRSVAQILQYATGTNVRDRGSTSDIGIRGSSRNQVLLLVDGLRRTGKYGSSDLIGLMAENIERIEIIRGPMSALYGADSVGGVVNIITKKPGSKFSGGATIMGGATGHAERGTIIGRAYMNSGEFYGTRHRFSFEAKEKESFRFNRNTRPTDLHDVSQKYLSYNGDWSNKKGRTLSWGMEYTNQDDDAIRFDGSRGHEKEDRVQGRINYNDINEDRIIDISGAYGVSDTSVVRSGGLAETTHFNRVEGNAFVTLFPIKDLVWTLGAGGRDENIKVNTFTPASTQSRTVYHVMTQAEWNWHKFSILAGVRYDDFSDFGGSVNPRVSASYTEGPFRLRVGYGHGFNAPAFTDQYISIERSSSRGGIIASTSIYGNPNLKPEKSRTFEAALSYQFHRGKLEAVYHRTDYSDLINFVALPTIERSGNIICTAGTTGGGMSPRRVQRCGEQQNVGRALIDGVELTLNQNLFSWWRFFASYEYLKTKDKETGQRLLNRAANHIIRFQNIFTYKKFVFNVNAYAQYNYLGQNARRQPVQADHYNIDIKLDYNMHKHFGLFAGIDNISNKKPEDGYTQFSSTLDPGARFFYGGIKAQF